VLHQDTKAGDRDLFRHISHGVNAGVVDVAGQVGCWVASGAARRIAAATHVDRDGRGPVRAEDARLGTHISHGGGRVPLFGG
jgi:hypothetical protein